MKIVSNSSVEFKIATPPSASSFNTHAPGQMIAPGASCCTIGSCSCSCGTTKM